MLSAKDRQFLQVVGRLKSYLLVMAFVVFLYVNFLPTEELQTATTLISVVLCGMFWLTQQLLGLISQLDFEVTRLTTALQRSMTDSERHEMIP